jgi:hypothetical protein
MRNAPDRQAIESAKDRPNSITPDAIKARIMAGEIVGALDYPEADRPLFWAAIARVRDDLPAVKPTWRTINEQHVDGLRTRQKLFRICPRQRMKSTRQRPKNARQRWRYDRPDYDVSLCGFSFCAAQCGAWHSSRNNKN